MTGTPHRTGSSPRTVPAAVLALALAGLGAPLHAQKHTVRGIAEAGAGGGSFDPFPSINQAGTVAFVRESSEGVKGVYTSRNGVETRLADTTGSFSDFSGVCIDDGGRVSFRATLDEGGSAILAVKGGPPETIAVTGGTYLSLDHGPAANATGAIVFRATLAGGTRALLLHERGNTTTLIDSTGGFRDFSGTPALNERGEIAFAATLDAGGSGVFKLWRGDLTTLAVTTPLRIAWTDPSINAAGVVVSTAFRDDGVIELVRFDQGSEEVVARSGEFFLSFGRPLVNNAGRIAFSAYREGSGTGLYAGPRPGPDTTLQHGARLFGSTLEQVQLSPSSFNASGQLAFSYALANGASGIAVVAPASRRPTLSVAGNTTVAAKKPVLTLRGAAVAEAGLSAVEITYRGPGPGKSRVTRRLATVSDGSWNFRFRPAAARTTLTIRAIDQEGQASEPVEVRILRR